MTRWKSASAHLQLRNLENQSQHDTIHNVACWPDLVNHIEFRSCRSNDSSIVFMQRSEWHWGQILGSTIQPRPPVVAVSLAIQSKSKKVGRGNLRIALQRSFS